MLKRVWVLPRIQYLSRRVLNAPSNSLSSCCNGSCKFLRCCLIPELKNDCWHASSELIFKYVTMYTFCKVKVLHLCLMVLGFRSLWNQETFSLQVSKGSSWAQIYNGCADNFKERRSLLDLKNEKQPSDYLSRIRCVETTHLIWILLIKRAHPCCQSFKFQPDHN